MCSISLIDTEPPNASDAPAAQAPSKAAENGDQQEDPPVAAEADYNSEAEYGEFTLEELVGCHASGIKVPQVPKPRGTGGMVYNIRDRMGLGDD